MKETNVVLILMSLPTVLPTTHTLYFENSCDYEIFYLKPDTVYYISWSGGYVSKYECSYGFRGVSYVYGQKYKLCVQFNEYKIRECDVELRLDAENGLMNSYSCFRRSKPTKWCGTVDGNIYVSLWRATREYSLTSLSHFELMISLEVETKHSVQAAIIRLIVIVALLAIIAISCYIRCYIRKKRSRDRQTDARGNVNLGAAISTNTTETTLCSQQVIHSTSSNNDFALDNQRSNDPPSYESVVRISPTDITFTDPTKGLQTQQDEPPPPSYTVAKEYIISQTL